MTNLVIDADDSHAVLLPVGNLSMSEDFDSKYELRGGIEITVDFSDANPIELCFLLAKDDSDVLGPDFTERHDLIDDLMLTFIVARLHRYGRVLKTDFSMNLSPLVLAASDPGRDEELAQSTSKWLAEFIGANFEFTAHVTRNKKFPDMLVASVTCTCTHDDTSASFDFWFSLSESEERGLSKEALDEYFGLVTP